MRISLKGRGKRGGARSILVYQSQKKVFFIFGYAKNERENVSDEELSLAKTFARELLNYSDDQLNKLVKTGKLIEVNYDG